LKPAATPAFVFEGYFGSNEGMGRLMMALSGEAETGSHKENASKQKSKAWL
jgi:hypothetical protein